MGFDPEELILVFKKCLVSNLIFYFICIVSPGNINPDPLLRLLTLRLQWVAHIDFLQLGPPANLAMVNVCCVLWFSLIIQVLIVCLGYKTQKVVL